MKVSGIMESTLPFQWMMICTLQRVLLRMKLFSPDYEDLNHMEYFYRKEVPELQSVVRVFLREREKVRKGWRLTKFPFSLLYWRPEAHKMEPHCDNALTAIQEGQQLSHSVSSVRKWKQAALTWLPSTIPRKDPVLCVLKILWWKKTNLQWQSLELLTINLSALSYINEKVGRVYAAENTIPLPIVSHPLTTAVDNSVIWFLDVPLTAS